MPLLPPLILSSVLWCSAALAAQGTIVHIPNTCPGPFLYVAGVPQVGASVSVGLPYTPGAPAYLVVGFRNLAWNNGTLPQLLPQVPPFIGCSQLAAHDVVSPMFVPSGLPGLSWWGTVNIPPNSTFVGLSFKLQAFVLDPAFGPSVTDGWDVTIG